MLSPEGISVLFTVEEALPPELESAWLRDLPGARRTRLEAMPGPSDRHRSLIAERLLRIGRREFGVDEDDRIESCVSHCPGRVVCALSVATPVGVDVEPRNASPPGRTSLYLNAQERAAAADDAAGLLRMWTRKEAVAKASGRRGIRSLHLIDVRAHVADCGGRSWQLVELDLGAGFVAHLACAVPAAPIRIRSVPVESLR